MPAEDDITCVFVAQRLASSGAFLASQGYITSERIEAEAAELKL